MAEILHRKMLMKHYQHSAIFPEHECIKTYDLRHLVYPAHTHTQPQGKLHLRCSLSRVRILLTAWLNRSHNTTTYRLKTSKETKEQKRFRLQDSAACESRNLISSGRWRKSALTSTEKIMQALSTV